MTPHDDSDYEFEERLAFLLDTEQIRYDDAVKQARAEILARPKKGDQGDHDLILQRPLHPR